MGRHLTRWARRQVGHLDGRSHAFVVTRTDRDEELWRRAAALAARLDCQEREVETGGWLRRLLGRRQRPAAGSALVGVTWARYGRRRA